MTIVSMLRPARNFGKTALRDAMLRGETGGINTKRLRELVRYQFRRGLHFAGVRFPDARDQDLRDRGIDLQWRIGVLRRELIRAGALNR